MLKIARHKISAIELINLKLFGPKRMCEHLTLHRSVTFTKIKVFYNQHFNRMSLALQHTHTHTSMNEYNKAYRSYKLQFICVKFEFAALLLKPQMTFSSMFSREAEQWGRRKKGVVQLQHHVVSQHVHTVHNTASTIKKTKQSKAFSIDQYYMNMFQLQVFLNTSETPVIR